MHLRYFIGVGVNLATINQIVQDETTISLDNLYSNIIKLIVIITVITFIFFILSLLFTKRIENIFKEYNKNINCCLITVMMVLSSQK
jgi:putative Mn2+ efflux pump MntP